VFRDHDVLTLCDKGVVGPVASVRLLWQVRFQADFLGNLTHMLRIVQAGGIECRRDNRHQQLHLRQLQAGWGALPHIERRAAHRDDFFAFDNTVARFAVLFEACPAHMRHSPGNSHGAWYYIGGTSPFLPTETRTAVTLPSASRRPKTMTWELGVSRSR